MNDFHVHFPLLTLKNPAGYHSYVNIHWFEWESQTSNRWTTTGSLRCFKDILQMHSNEADKSVFAGSLRFSIISMTSSREEKRHFQ